MTQTPPEFHSAEEQSLQAPDPGDDAASMPNLSYDGTDALVGRKLGHFRVEDRLGSGAMASVYRATDLILDRRVALKVLLPGADDVVRERFRQEARTVSVLDHPHIVHTLQVGQSDGITYIAMDLIEGVSLADLLGEQGRLSIMDTCRLLEPIARALAYAHRQHVVHRDVKPSNILLRRLPSTTTTATSTTMLAPGLRIAGYDQPLTPLLSDFGIALALDSPQLTAAGRTVGTPTYMAPEQAANSYVIDGRVDIYALGIVLYRCLVGRPPFVGSTTQVLHAHVYEPLTIPVEIAQQMPPLILNILRQALAKEPHDRYADASEMAADLARAGGVVQRGNTGGRKATERPSGADQSTATLAALAVPAPASSSTRVQVLIPAPAGQNAASKRTASARSFAGERAVDLLPAKTPVAPVRKNKQPRDRVRLALGLSAATVLVLIGIFILRMLLPIDQLVQRVGLPAQAVATTPVPALPTARATSAIALGTSAPALVASAISTPTLSALTEQPNTLRPPIAPDIDVELYWDVVVDDYNQRRWNQTLDNLILIMRSESDAFNSALAGGSASAAKLVRTVLLDNRAASIWTQWHDLFDPQRIEAMFFASYVGLATQANQAGSPQTALEHFDDALALRPNDLTIVALRNATDEFLRADVADRETARRTLGETHRNAATTFALTNDQCDAYDQLAAAANLLGASDFVGQLATYRQGCDQQLQEVAGAQLRTKLSGAIIYSTQEGADYHVYRQPLEPDQDPKLLVVDARQPRQSPDGSHLAFYNVRSNGLGIGRFDLAAGLLPNDRSPNYTTTQQDAKDSPPTWRRDSSWLAFASVRDGDGRSRIYVKQANPANDVRVLADGQDPAWQPFGESWIAYSGRGPLGSTLGLWRVSEDGQRFEQLTGNERDRRPVWALDARYLIFMSDGRDRNWELYRLTVPTDEGSPKPILRLTDNPAQDGLPAVSPDGKWVAFVSDDGGRWRIWVAPLDGAEPPLPIAEIRGTLLNWLEHSIQWVAN